MSDGQRCFGVPRLNNHNYQAWKFKMEMHLIREKTWYTIAETSPSPVTEEWNEANESARAAIGLCIEDNQTSLVRNCTTAKACWDALKAYHDKASEVYLLKRLARLELSESDEMEKHLQTYTDLVQQVADIGDGLPERLQVALLLCSLPDSYDHLTTALEQRPRQELTLQLVKSKLLAESEKRSERSAHSGSSGLALRVDHRRRAGEFGDGGNSSEKVETRTCYGCKQPGHLKRDCPQSKANERQRAPNVELVKDVPDQPVAWMVGSNEPSSWFVDSGASRHMTGNRRFFTALKQSGGTDVLLANGEKAEVAGVGRGIFVGVNDAGDAVEIEMYEVLFVPKLTSGLVSVSALAKKNFEVVFSARKCVIRRPGGLVCAVAERYGNLYRLSVPEQAMVSVQRTWHRRLGHQDPNTVWENISKHLADGIKVENCGVYTGCECSLEGKMPRIPFPKSVARGTKEKLDKDADRITISRDVKFLGNWNVLHKRDSAERPQTEESVVELEPPAVVAACDVAPELVVEQGQEELAPYSEEEADLEGYHSAEELYEGVEDGAADGTRRWYPRRRNREVLPTSLRDFVDMALADHDEPITCDQVVSYTDGIATCAGQGGDRRKLRAERQGRIREEEC